MTQQLEDWAERDLQLDWRPDTYWPNTPNEQTVLARIKGTARRQAVAAALAGTSTLPPDAVDALLAESLDDDTRRLLSRIHPRLMGGEYLPDTKPDEVEIARAQLESTLGDVISVRARRTPDGITYRVVDEYTAEGSSWDCAPQHSTVPLSLRELIGLIDSAGLNDTIRDQQLECYSPEQAADFVSIYSDLYTELDTYYDRRNAEWVSATYAAWAVKEETDEEARPLRPGVTRPAVPGSPK